MDALSTASVSTFALWLWFLGWAIALSVVDIREHRLPNRMVASCLAGCLVIASIGAALTGDWGPLVMGAAGSVAAVGAFTVLHIVGGLGMGDVKYAAVTGLVLGTLGWSAVWWGHVLGFVLAGAVVVVGLSTRMVQRRSAVPFGPFMALGAMVTAVGALAWA